MADDLVVIGKGKLITSGTVEDIVNRAKGTGVFVRSPKLSALEEALKKAKFTVDKLDGGLSVRAAKTDDIGRVAHKANIPVFELTNRTASLEDAFLEITDGAQEYKAGGEK